MAKDFSHRCILMLEMAGDAAKKSTQNPSSSPAKVPAWQDSARYGSLGGQFLCRNSLSTRTGGKFCELLCILLLALCIQNDLTNLTDALVEALQAKPRDCTTLEQAEGFKSHLVHAVLCVCLQARHPLWRQHGCASSPPNSAALLGQELGALRFWRDTRARPGYCHTWSFAFASSYST